MCSSGGSTNSDIDHRQRRHPQLLRQMEQEETQKSACDILHPNDDHSITSLSSRVNVHVIATKCQTRVSCSKPQLSNQSESRRPTKHHLPSALESQGSGSTESGNTVMSMSVDGSSSSSKSTREGSKSGFVRGALCSSSASSSTEETEARERRFGSVDLHPLPNVTPILNPRRSFHTNPSYRQLQYLVLAALQNHYALKTAGDTRAARNEASISMDVWKPLTSVHLNELVDHHTSGSSTLIITDPSSAIQHLSNLNSSQLLSRLPSHLWSCLICPVHSISWLQSLEFFPKQLDEAILGTTTSAESSADRPVGALEESAVGIPVVLSLSGSCPSDKDPRIGPYQLGPTLGRGNFAVVKLAKHVPTKQKVAIKIVNKELIGSANLTKVTRELEAMKRCQHPHIVRLYHVMESETNIFMVTEYASKGEVFDHISKSRAFSEKEARELFWQIVCAIDFCHNSGVVHRDLKAENLLLDWELKIKVADFGFCNFFKPNELLSTHCGSPQYAAPELFKGEPYDGRLADVWSLGVILYILVCGSFPFPGESLGDIRNQVLRGLVRFPFFLSTACEQVIRCMLQVDPARRFKLRQVINTPWMQASPNVLHYQLMITNYEAKAKSRQFDEVFCQHFPDHSQLAKNDQARRTQAELDANVLRALSIGTGFDETQIRLSTIQNKCDRFHAAYQLLMAKIHYFKRNPNLRQYVDDHIHSSENRDQSSQNRNVNSSTPRAGPSSCASIPDRFEKTAVDISDLGPPFSSVTSCDPESHDPSARLAISPLHVEDIWKSRTQPGRVDLTVALFILRADEDLIVPNLGFDGHSMSGARTPSVRRHTVQLTTSPITVSKPADDISLENRHQRPSATGSMGSESTQSPNAGVDLHAVQRVVSRRFPRQTTQPCMDGLHSRGPYGRQPEQLHAVLDWIRNPWSTDVDESNSSQSQDRRSQCTSGPMHLPSLELGQEAATTALPVVHKQPDFCLSNFALSFEGDGLITKAGQYSVDNQITEHSSVDGLRTSAMAVDHNTMTAGTPSDPSTILPWDGQIRDQVEFEQNLTTNRLHHSSSFNLGERMDITATNPPGQPSNVSEDLEDGGECGLTTLLPQLNLPANVPVMMHQPVARFTIKDPHLLAPPEFMTPQCSSFPRRSSDGAAELQPLHRPALAVGGSYPEQASYRNSHPTPGTDTSLLSNTYAASSGPPVTPRVEIQCNPATSPITESSAVREQVRLSSSSGTHNPATSKSGVHSLRTSRQPFQSARCGSPQSRAHSLLWSGRHVRHVHPLGTTASNRVQSARLDSSDKSADSDIFDSTITISFQKHQKRFSLPVSCQAFSASTGHSAAVNSSAAASPFGPCLCNRPVTRELVDWAQRQLNNWCSNPMEGTPTSVTLPHRRGSEASQMSAWKQRLSQENTGMVHPSIGQDDFHAEPLSFSTSLSGSGEGQHWSPLASLTPCDGMGTTPTPSIFPLNLEPASPLGIQLNELKTELRKLEAEDSDISGPMHLSLTSSMDTSKPSTTSSVAVNLTCLSASSQVTANSLNHHIVPRHQRVSSLKITRRACSALAGPSQPLSSNSSSRLHQRHRYSVGDRLDDPSKTDRLESFSTTFMETESYNLMSQAAYPPIDYSHHRLVTSSLSNPEQNLYPSDVPTPVSSPMFLSAKPMCGRTALSSPESTPATPFRDLPITNHSSLSPTNLGLPLSAGVKRRSIGLTTGQKQNHGYLHMVQHAGGSLDRRFDLLSNSKRKLYQEWLPKISAFSRKARTPSTEAVPCSAQTSLSTGTVLDVSLHPDATSTSTTTMSPASSICTSLKDMDQDSDAQAEEEERDCALAPLQSQLPFGIRPASAFTSALPGPPEFSSLFSSFEHSSTFSRNRAPINPAYLGEAAEIQRAPWLFLYPTDDDDDLAEIERVNQRLLLSGGMEESDSSLGRQYPVSSQQRARSQGMLRRMNSISGVSFEHGD